MNMTIGGISQIQYTPSPAPAPGGKVGEQLLQNEPSATFIGFNNGSFVKEAKQKDYFTSTLGYKSNKNTFSFNTRNQASARRFMNNTTITNSPTQSSRKVELMFNKSNSKSYMLRSPSELYRGQKEQQFLSFWTTRKTTTPRSTTPNIYKQIEYI